MTSSDRPGEPFGQATRDHLARVEEHNATALDTVADLLLDCVRDDGLVFASGSGHSLALVLETFYRAGGLACVRPLVHLGLLPLAGGGASTRLERVAGLAEVLVRQTAPGPSDVGVVFSNSGVNPFPVEFAASLAAAGTPVVAVVSVAHMRAAPARADAKLGDVAAHVVDTLVPAGDVAYPPGDGRTAAWSSLTSVYCWNLVLARLFDRAERDGVDLPLWTSANVPGGDERNAALAERYRGRIPLL